MTRSWLILVAGIVSIAAVAQTVPATALPKGTLLRVILNNTLDGKEAKAGDPVEGVVVGYYAADGTVVPGRFMMTLVGHVAEVHARTKDQPESAIGVVFDKIVIADGRSLKLTAVIKNMTGADLFQPQHELGGTWTVPTSGDDPMQRAAGPMQGAAPPPPQKSRTIGPAAGSGSDGEPKVKGLHLRTDPSETATLITSRKSYVVVKAHTRLAVLVTGSGEAH